MRGSDLVVLGVIGLFAVIAVAGLSTYYIKGYTANSTVGFVPYTGATGNVDLGAWNLTASNLFGVISGSISEADKVDGMHAIEFYWRNTSISLSFLNLTGSASLSQLPTIPDSKLEEAGNYLLVNGTRALTANWDAGSYNITASWFKGKLDWSDIQNPPATYPPSAHNHAASDITSGTFGTAYLDLSALAQNIAFTSTQTVDGVDISALLLKTTKVTTLATIWDKTTKIDYSDTDFADQPLLTSSHASFSTITASGGVDNQLKLSSGRGIAWGGVLKQYADGGDMLFSSIGALKSDTDGQDNLGTSSLRWLNGYFYGKVIAESGVITRYDTGDYGVAWASYTPPTGTNGLIIIVYNSNAGVLASREYVYTAGAWHYIIIT